MDAESIVKTLDVIEDLSTSQGVSGPVAAVDQFEFERAPEAFHGGVVVAIGLAAHRGDQAGVG